MNNYRVQLTQQQIQALDEAAGEAFEGISPPRNYLPDPGLVAAVNVAIKLRKPLLLTGKPGTGKSSVARSVAWQLQLGRPLEVVVKSDSQASDLYYDFDAVGRFSADTADKAALNFINYQALGKAILYSRDIDDPALSTVLSPRHREAAKAAPDRWSAPRRTVVLVDEIDKAQRDVPNDILVEIERRCFFVRELGNVGIQAGSGLDPLVIITSNSERALPDAFLRRCIYFNMPFPDEAQMREILVRQLGDRFADTEHPTLKQAVSFFEFIRTRGLAKEPATAELIDWLSALYEDESQGIDFSSQHVRHTIKVCLTKTHYDQAMAEQLVNDWQARAQG